MIDLNEARVRVERRDEVVELWAPGLGRAEVRRRWLVEADEPDERTRWHVVERAGQPTLVLEEWEGTDHDWPTNRGRAWIAPAWTSALLDLLGPDPTPARARAVLLAGIAHSWELYDVCDTSGGDDPGDDPDAPDPLWRACSLEDLAAAMVTKARDLAAAFATRIGLDLDASRFEPLASSARSGAHYSHGIDVVGWDEARVVGEVTFAGAPALLVATVHSDNDQPFDLALEEHGLSLTLVPFTPAAEAERIALEPSPGVLLPARPVQGVRP